MTDAGLASLTGLARLQTLELKLNSGVTDAAIDQLKQLKGLKTLGLRKPARPKKRSRSSHAALPGCKIEME